MSPRLDGRAGRPLRSGPAWAESLGALMLLVCLLCPAPSLAGVEQDLQAGLRAYDRSDYKQAIRRLRPLLYPTIRLSKQAQVIHVHKLLAISYVFEKKRVEAEKQFLSILSIEPNYRLDSLVDPIAAVELFEEVKRRNADTIQKLLERERKETERRRLEELRRKAEERRIAALARQGKEIVERTVTRHPTWLSFVPLGVGQFQNGHRNKGIVLLSSELALGSLSVGTYLAGYFAYGGRSLTLEEYDRARALRLVQIVSAGACAATVVYGIIDALVYHKPQTVIERRYQRKLSGSLRVGLAPSLQLDGKAIGMQLDLTF